MITIDVLGKPCPIPVIEAKKALAEQSDEVVLVKADNIAAVQNLEKMANGYVFVIRALSFGRSHGALPPWKRSRKPCRPFGVYTTPLRHSPGLSVLTVRLCGGRS